MPRLSRSKCWVSIAVIGVLAGCGRSDLLIGEEAAPDAPDASAKETEPDAAPLDAGTDASSDAAAVDTGADIVVEAGPPPLIVPYAPHSLAAIYGGTGGATD